jgi:hypothetical protein
MIRELRLTMSVTFSEEIRLSIEKINHFLTSHGIRRIDQNPEFVLIEISHEDYALYRVSREGCIELSLEFSIWGLVVGTSDFSEFYELSQSDILNDYALYEHCLSNLFLYPIVIKKCRFGFNFFYVKNSGGELVLIGKRGTNLVSMLLWPLERFPMDCKSFEYRPYSEKANPV